MNSDSALKARRGCSPFTLSELEAFRALLLDHQVEVSKMFDGLSDSARSTPGGSAGGTSSVPGHIAELATDSNEQEMSIDFMGRAQEDLREIQEALERIDYRCYGLCNDCGQPIPPVRLEAMPTAQYCIDCKSRMELEQQ